MLYIIKPLFVFIWWAFTMIVYFLFNSIIVTCCIILIFKPHYLTYKEVFDNSDTVDYKLGKVKLKFDRHALDTLKRYWHAGNWDKV